MRHAAPRPATLLILYVTLLAALGVWLVLDPPIGPGPLQQAAVDIMLGPGAIPTEPAPKPKSKPRPPEPTAPEPAAAPAGLDWVASYEELPAGGRYEEVPEGMWYIDADEHWWWCEHGGSWRRV